MVESFLSSGDISVDIGVTAAPVITANYIESYHKVRTQLKAADLSAVNAKLQSSGACRDFVAPPAALTCDL